MAGKLDIVQYLVGQKAAVESRHPALDRNGLHLCVGTTAWGSGHGGMLKCLIAAKGINYYHIWTAFLK